MSNTISERRQPYSIGSRWWFASLALTAACSTAARAQDTIPFPSGKELTAAVTAAVLTQNGAWVKLRYAVANNSGSQQSIRILALPAGLPLTSVYELHGPQGWFFRKSVRSDSAAIEWVAPGGEFTISPGSSNASFTAEAQGLLGVSTFAAQGLYGLPDTPEDSDTVLGDRPSFWANSYVGLTIRHVPIPDGSTVGSLATRLADLVDRTCNELVWISSSALCLSLDSLLVGGPLRLGEFLDSLNANRGGGASLGDNPYYLLKSNRDYIRGLIAPPRFALVYDCGNRFKARNKLDVAIPATWTVKNTTEVGTLTLPPKPPGLEFSETEFEVTNQGFVRLWYDDGGVLQESNPTYTTC